jgi:hypothetical protein
MIVLTQVYQVIPNMLNWFYNGTLGKMGESIKILEFDQKHSIMLFILHYIEYLILIDSGILQSLIQVYIL